MAINNQAGEKRIKRVSKCQKANKVIMRESNGS